MNIGSFSVDVFVAQFFSGLSETPCLLIPLVRTGRRPITMLTLFLSGVACFLTLLLSRHNSELQLQISIAWKLKDVVRIEFSTRCFVALKDWMEYAIW